MPAICRENDLCTGHGCHPPRKSIGGNATVLINGRKAHCVGDKWEYHTCGDDTHDGVTSTGSSTVFVGGKAIGRIGDPIDCGSTISVGSPTVMSD